MGDASGTQKPSLSDELSELTKSIDPSEILSDTSSTYIANSQTWSTSKDLHPRLVVRPTTVESLAQLVDNLFKTNLHYAVRSQGFGSASAKDVLISLSAFDEVQFNKEEEYVILGTGQPWIQYHETMQEIAPDWTIVAARTPGVGVGGSTMCGGFSWLSAQYGCISDPANLLDAYVVKADGSHFWASEQDPELLWAMRGSGGGFAIATHFKFRARHYPQNGTLWGGPILVPRSAIDQVTKGIADMVEKDARNEVEPSAKGKTGMFLYVVRKELLEYFGAEDDMLLVHAFDERGTEAGRAEFKWALDIEGAYDQTKGNMTMLDVSRLQENLSGLRGKATAFWSPVSLTKSTHTPLSEEIIKKAIAWWTSILDEPGSIKDNGFLLFELFTCIDNVAGQHASAWPRPPGYTHQVLFGTGCAPDATQEERDRARQVLLNAHTQVFGRDVKDLEVVPNALEDFHNIKRVYGQNYDRLREVKTRVDPHDRLGGWFRPLTT